MRSRPVVDERSANRARKCRYVWLLIEDQDQSFARAVPPPYAGRYGTNSIFSLAGRTGDGLVLRRRRNDQRQLRTHWVGSGDRARRFCNPRDGRRLALGWRCISAGRRTHGTTNGPSPRTDHPRPSALSSTSIRAEPAILSGTLPTQSARSGRICREDGGSGAEGCGLVFRCLGLPVIRSLRFAMPPGRSDAVTVVLVAADQHIERSETRSVRVPG